VTSSTLYPTDGTTQITKDSAVWTLAHRGYSGCGRLDIWVYPSKAAALREGAKLAMACGLDEDAQAAMLFAKGSYEKVLERYEHTHPDTHLLRVQPAFLQHLARQSVAPRGRFPPDNVQATHHVWGTALRRLARLNPARRLWAAPRGIKRKMPKWHVKRAHHGAWPGPQHSPNYLIQNIN
jgi:hypothetical protein